VKFGTHIFGFALATGVAAFFSAARADAPVPMGVADLLGARALSIGASQGLTGGNDAIFTNAASLATQRRYSVDTQWLLDRAGNQTALHALGGSAVDSVTGPVTGGFAYTRILAGPWTGNIFRLPVAVPISSTLFLGATGKYDQLNGPAGGQVSALNADASAFWRPSTLFGLGVSGYNLISSGHVQLQPRALGTGISLGDEARFHLTCDWRGDFERQGKLTHLLALGAEVLLAQYVPVRAGFTRDWTRNGTFFSVGTGLVTTSGYAIDVSYRQSFENPAERTFAAALKLFL